MLGNCFQARYLLYALAPCVSQGSALEDGHKGEGGDDDGDDGRDTAKMVDGVRDSANPGEVWAPPVLRP